MDLFKVPVFLRTVCSLIRYFKLTKPETVLNYDSFIIINFEIIYYYLFKQNLDVFKIFNFQYENKVWISPFLEYLFSITLCSSIGLRSYDDRLLSIVRKNSSFIFNSDYVTRVSEHLLNWRCIVNFHKLCAIIAQFLWNLLIMPIWINI